MTRGGQGNAGELDQPARAAAVASLAVTTSCQWLHWSADLVTLDRIASKKVDLSQISTFWRPFLVLHVCLIILCFCLLKSIAVATLFSQLLILKHFKKNHQTNLKFSWFRKKSEIEKNLKKSENFRWKSRKPENFRKMFNGKFIEIFGFSAKIFGFFEIFSISDFFRKSRNFQLFLMIFFKKVL